MSEIFIVACATFFATVAPLNVAAVYAALSARATATEQRRMALRGVALAAVILLLFAVAGETLLKSLGVSLPALRAAGGVLLLLIGIDMVFARASGGTSTTQEENRDASTRDDLAVFPLAMPLIAGPGTMGAVILLIADAEGRWQEQAAVILALVLILAATLVALLLAGQVRRIFGITGMHVVSRIFGVLLTALAVQFIFDGIAQSGLLSATG